MLDMVLNLLKAVGEPVGGAFGFLLLAVLVLGVIIGYAILVGVIRSRDANLIRRFKGVWWAAANKAAADHIATFRKRNL